MTGGCLVRERHAFHSKSIPSWWLWRVDVTDAQSTLIDAISTLIDAKSALSHRLQTLIDASPR
eukprot:2185544-Pyramimonas_sp.AAC.1